MKKPIHIYCDVLQDYVFVEYILKKSRPIIISIFYGGENITDIFADHELDSLSDDIYCLL